MTPILLRDFTLRKGRAQYVMTLWPIGQEPIDVETDGNLGHINAALSLAFKEIYVQVTGKPYVYPDEFVKWCKEKFGTDNPDDVCSPSSINLSRFWVEPLVIAPYRWKVSMVSGPYSFSCNVDSSLENLINCFAAAMKFFGQKYGLVKVFPEVTHNFDRAGEAGLLQGKA